MANSRLISIDWLECFCLESEIHEASPEYFRKHGWYVRVRDHGTPQYAQMFTICDLNSKLPVIEVRRLPYSVKSEDNPSGLFHPKACHLRLSNRACYFHSPVGFMQTFIRQHGFTFKSLSRIDIAYDFQRFDSGDYPQSFLQRYMEGKFRKVGQIELFPHAHETNIRLQDRVNELAKQLRQIREFIKSGGDINGHDVAKALGSAQSKLNVLKDFSQVEESAHATDLDLPLLDENGDATIEIVKEWNYVCWRSDTSPVGTKLYNKSKELDRDGHRKPYIEAKWQQMYEQGFWRRGDDVFRLEFSIRSQCKGFVRTFDGECLRNDLPQYETESGLLDMFTALVEKYFRFVHTQKSKNGKLLDKSKSAKKVLFIFGQEDFTFNNLTVETKQEPARKFNLLMNALNDIRQDSDHCYKDFERNIASVLKKTLEDRYLFENDYDQTFIDYLSDRRVTLTQADREQVESHLAAIREIFGTQSLNVDEGFMHHPFEGSLHHPHLPGSFGKIQKKESNREE